MALFEKVLCPVDFDDNSVKAVRLARRIALREEGKVYLLHVVVPTDPLVISAPLVERRNEANARAMLNRLVEQELAGVAAAHPQYTERVKRERAWGRTHVVRCFCSGFRGRRATILAD